MTFRPASNGLAAVVALVVPGLLSFVWWPAAWLVPALLAAMLAAMAFDWAWLRRTLAELTIERRHPSSVGRDKPFPVELVLGGRPLPQGSQATVRDLVPEAALPHSWQAALPAASGVDNPAVQYELRIPQRGNYRFGSVWLRLRGRLGMLEAQRELACPSQIKVLPEALVSPEEFASEESAERRMLDQATRTRLQGEGTEFESLAEFRAGDDPRRIDWRSTARTKRLIVRRYQLEQHRDLVLVLDCGRMMGADVGSATKLDQAVNAALLLGRVALVQGDRCGIGIFDSRVRGYLPPISGRSALAVLIDQLYSVQAEWVESDFAPMFAALQTRQSKRCTVVVLSDVVDPDTSERYRGALASLAQRHTVVFVAVRTPLLDQTAVAPVDSGLDASRKAVALRLLRERERALHAMRRSGVHVLDVEPRQITVPLINQYLALRQHSVM